MRKSRNGSTPFNIIPRRNVRNHSLEVLVNGNFVARYWRRYSTENYGASTRERQFRKQNLHELCAGDEVKVYQFSCTPKHRLRSLLHVYSYIHSQIRFRKMLSRNDSDNFAKLSAPRDVFVVVVNSIKASPRTFARRLINFWWKKWIGICESIRGATLLD